MSSSFAVSDIIVQGMKAKIYLLEYAQDTVFQTFNQYVQQLQNALFTTPQTDLDEARAEQACQAIEGLRNLMLYGTNTNQGPQYITKQMAEQVGILFQSLHLVGIDTQTEPFSFGSLANAQLWQHLVASSLVLTGLFSFPSLGNHSLQSLVELSYVKTANNILAEQLQGLEKALSTSQMIMNHLTNLQNLHNKIHMPTRPPFAFDLSGAGLPPNPTSADLKEYAKRYSSAASAYFNTPIFPVPINVPTASGYSLEEATVPANTSGIRDPNILSLIKHLEGLTHLKPALPPRSPETLQPGKAYYAKYDPASHSYNIYASDRSKWSDQLEVPVLTNYHFNLGSGPQEGDFSFILAENGSVPSSLMEQYGLKASKARIYDESKGPSSTVSGIPIYFTDPNTQQAGAKARNFFDNFQSGHLIHKNLISLSSSYHGITNTNDPDIQSAIRHMGSNQFQPLHNMKGSLSVWIGFKEGKGFKVIDTHDPAVLKRDIQDLIDIRTQLSAQASALAMLIPTAGTDENSLLARLRAVLEDIHKTFKGPDGKDITKDTPLSAAIPGFTAWMVDNYNTARQELDTQVVGKYQQNISHAITASQHLNNSQNEDVRNFLFVFEEYYKSAASVLQKFTQLVERIAQNISGK